MTLQLSEQWLCLKEMINNTKALSIQLRAFYNIIGRNSLLSDYKYTKPQISNIPADVRKRMNMITGTTYLIMTR